MRGEAVRQMRAEKSGKKEGDVGRAGKKGE